MTTKPTPLEIAEEILAKMNNAHTLLELGQACDYLDKYSPEDWITLCEAFIAQNALLKEARAVIEDNVKSWGDFQPKGNARHSLDKAREWLAKYGDNK